MNIFALAQLIVHLTPCRTTIQLCARVALMVGSVYLIVFGLLIDFFQRAVHVECQGSEKYWNLVDARLEFIRSASELSTKKIAKYVKLHPHIP
jgi:hypothetical protein